MYYKITNKNENHYGFQYVDGLNILNTPFEKYGSCVPGGLYFTTKENIHRFFSYGIWLREVTLPVSDPDFQLCRDGNKFRANKIILDKRYSLADPNTYLIIDSDITKNEHLMDHASAHGYIDVLNKLKNVGFQLKYSILSIDVASSNNHIEALEWWKNSGLELKYSSVAIDVASANGHLDVLEWWKKSGLEMKYSFLAVDSASINQHIDVLQWWYNSKLEIKYSELAINIGLINHQIDVLN